MFNLSSIPKIECKIIKKCLKIHCMSLIWVKFKMYKFTKFAL